MTRQAFARRRRRRFVEAAGTRSVTLTPSEIGLLARLEEGRYFEPGQSGSYLT